MAGEAALAAPAPPEELREPPFELSWHDYAVYLLHVASEVEHALMVQYLYAAYSLGGAALVDVEQHEKARKWREVILGIAKEEMGHLITVQNVLRLIGGPLHLEREDYPFRSEFYPFPFALEPISKVSLAKYVVAEAPAKWLDEDPEAQPIKELATDPESGRETLPVGKLYERVVKLFQRDDALTDEDFRIDTLPYQASFDEWGRGYTRGERGNIGKGSPDKTPNVLVEPVADREGVIKALQNIAQQGENPAIKTETPEKPEESHFQRFLTIYREFPADNPPSRNTPANPTTSPGEPGSITNQHSQLWAHLFNLRYRKLLYTLKHAFHVEEDEVTDRPTARGNLISWTFGEMYNLRSIAAILVTLPLNDGDDGKHAGPPFQAPYTLSLPDWDSDKWRVHRDLINGSVDLITEIEKNAAEEHRLYLRALREHDALTLQVVQRLFSVQLEKDEREEGEEDEE
ncbi:MAG: hypothetical protein DMF56_02205 [Acidobacteria bacterium]|nr:MAG: hypothetical protein DMF56_02205 [Acidobacteriota bacterium]